MANNENCVLLLDKMLDRAEKLFDSNLADGYGCLQHANRLYNHLENKQGFDFERWQRLNGLCFRYFDRYLSPPQ